MPPRSVRHATEAPPPGPDLAEPPYYTATEDLYVFDAEAGAVPQLAYRAGDRVVPDVVEPNGWQGKVAVPEHFEGQLAALAEPEPAAKPAPVTTPSQGTAPPANTSPKE